MDNQKKEKLVAIILTTLVSLAVSVVACILGVSPDTLIKSQPTETAVAYSAICTCEY